MEWEVRLTGAVVCLLAEPPSFQLPSKHVQRQQNTRQSVLPQWTQKSQFLLSSEALDSLFTIVYIHSIQTAVSGR